MRKILFVVSLVMGFSHSALASEVEIHEGQKLDPIEVMQTGRYTQVKNIPPVDQLNPLKVVVKTKIPQSVLTVRESVEFLLVRSGYSLADNDVLSEEAKTLLNHQLPQIHRTIGPMTLDLALQTLSGDSFELVVDPVHRKIAYELSSKLARVE